jgi:peptide deformylase
MRILTVNNKKDEKILRQPTKKIDFKTFPKKELRELVVKLRLVMKKANGVGLSANQIGESLSIFVARLGEKFYVFINPEIIKKSEETIILEEGCLSVPGYFGMVERPEKITIVGYDQKGKKIKIKAWGVLARVFQHEIDHLNGVLFIDKAKNLRKQKTYERTKIYGIKK